LHDDSSRESQPISTPEALPQDQAEQEKAPVQQPQAPQEKPSEESEQPAPSTANDAPSAQKPSESGTYVEPLLHQETPHYTEDRYREDDGTNLETQIEMELLRRQVKRNHSAVITLTVSMLVLLVVLLGGVFYLVHQLNLKDNRIAHFEALSQQLTAKPAALKPRQEASPTPASATAQPDFSKADAPQTPAEPTQPAAPAEASQPQAGQAAGNPKVANPAPSKATPQKSATPKAQQRKAQETASSTPQPQPEPNYSKDVRIRTGAYNIVGIAKTITVKPGQTLSGISRSQLGPGMECYIEAVNGGRTEFKAGEKVKIPALKLKKRK
jgi:hypothetical protein